MDRFLNVPFNFHERSLDVFIALTTADVYTIYVYMINLLSIILESSIKRAVKCVPRF